MTHRHFAYSLAVLAILALGTSGCETYYTGRPSGIQTPPAPPAPSGDLKALQDQIKALQEQAASTKAEGATSDQAKIDELEKKIAELQKAIEDLSKTPAGPAETPSGGGTSTGPDMTPPTVIQTTPARDAGDIDKITTIAIKFDAKVKAGTVTKDSLVISASGDTPSPATAVNDTNNSEFVFTVPETIPGKTYKVTLKKDGVQDEAGNARTEDYTWNFETKPLPPDTQPPTVVSAKALTDGKTIEITFSEPVDRFKMIDNKSVILTNDAVATLLALGSIFGGGAALEEYATNGEAGSLVEGDNPNTVKFVAKDLFKPYLLTKDDKGNEDPSDDVWTNPAPYHLRIIGASSKPEKATKDMTGNALPSDYNKNFKCDGTGEEKITCNGKAVRVGERQE